MSESYGLSAADVNRVEAILHEACGFRLLAGLRGTLQLSFNRAAETSGLAAGQFLTGRDFGNYACGLPPPCVMPPPGMAAWRTFDEAGGTPAAADATHPSPAKNALQLFGGAAFSSAGMVGGALHLGAASDYALAPHIQQLGLEFGTGSFALDAWLNMSPGLAGPRVVAEKRDLISTTPTAPAAGRSTWTVRSAGWRSAPPRSPRRSPARRSRPTPGRTWPFPSIAWRARAPGT